MDFYQFLANSYNLMFDKDLILICLGVIVFKTFFRARERKWRNSLTGIPIFLGKQQTPLDFPSIGPAKPEIFARYRTLYGNKSVISLETLDHSYFKQISKDYVMAGISLYLIWWLSDLTSRTGDQSLIETASFFNHWILAPGALYFTLRKKAWRRGGLLRIENGRLKGLLAEGALPYNTSMTPFRSPFNRKKYFELKKIKKVAACLVGERCHHPLLPEFDYYHVILFNYEIDPNKKHETFLISAEPDCKLIASLMMRAVINEK